MERLSCSPKIFAELALIGNSHAAAYNAAAFVIVRQGMAQVLSDDQLGDDRVLRYESSPRLALSICGGWPRVGMQGSTRFTHPG
jgi:hypothetical protein